MNFFLLLLIFLFIFFLVLFINQYNKLKLLVNLMPNKKFIKYKGEKHPLVGKEFPFEGEFLTADSTVALLTSSTCSVCQDVFDQTIDITNRYNLSFLHLELAPKSQSKVLVDFKKNYYHIKIPGHILVKNKLTEFPLYIIIKDKKVIEIAYTTRRIEYLMENKLLVNL